MLKRILNELKPKTIEEIEEDIIKKTKEQQELKLKLDALKKSKELDNNINKLKKEMFKY